MIIESWKSWGLLFCFATDEVLDALLKSLSPCFAEEPRPPKIQQAHIVYQSLSLSLYYTCLYDSITNRYSIYTQASSWEDRLTMSPS